MRQPNGAGRRHAPTAAIPRALTAMGMAAWIAASIAACAAPVPVGLPAPERAPSTPSSPIRPGMAASAATSGMTPVLRWPVRTAEHMDVWLHAFAMLTDDTATVPLFRRGYRDSLTVLRNQRTLFTALDSNRQVLATRLAASPGYRDAQFFPLEMASWEVLRSLTERFLAVDGDLKRAGDRELAARLAPVATIFPTAADREWLRRFLHSVTDERLRFYAEMHSRLVRSRAAVVTAVDSLWQRVYRPRFDRFLTGAGLRTGSLVLSAPLGGEGRSGAGRDKQLVVLVPFPQRVEEAQDVVLVFAHEITAALVTAIVADNSSPAERRSGAAERAVTMGQVRAGALLLERIAPELVTPYQRYYLAQSGRPAVTLDGAALRMAFQTRFPFAPTMQDALQRQLDLVLGGI